MKLKKQYKLPKILESIDCNDYLNNVGHDKNSVKLLLSAIEKDAVEQVKTLLNLSSIFCNNSTVDYENILHISMEKGSIKIIEFLLETKPTLIDFVTKDGSNLLHLAAKFNHLILLKSLHTLKSALIEDITKDGSTPLHLAAEHNNVEVVEFLLNIRPNLIEEISSNGDTALHRAANYANNIEMIALLITISFDAVYALNKDSNTPLQCAIIKDRIDAIKAFEDITPFDIFLNAYIEVSSNSFMQARQIIIKNSEPHLLESLLLYLPYESIQGTICEYSIDPTNRAYQISSSHNNKGNECSIKAKQLIDQYFYILVPYIPKNLGALIFEYSIDDRIKDPYSLMELINSAIYGLEARIILQDDISIEILSALNDPNALETPVIHLGELN